MTYQRVKTMTITTPEMIFIRIGDNVFYFQRCHICPIISINDSRRPEILGEAQSICPSLKIDF